MKQIIHFHNARLLRRHRIVEGDLWIRGGKIVPPQADAHQIIDMQGRLIAPGFIDLQVNGGFGVDITREPQRVEEVARQLPRYGVTSFLPTLISSSQPSYQKAMPFLLPYCGGGCGANILGIHLEGPFLHPEMCRAHEKRWMASPEQWEKWYGTCEGVKLVTLAPELPGALQAIKALCRKGVVVSAGHTTATWEEMERAIQAGVTMVTHLYNAMEPFHHRKSGVIDAALIHPDLFYSVIADGVHVSSAALQMAWKAHREGLCLVTDAMEALGAPLGRHCLGQREVEVTAKGAYIVGTEILAGSVIGMNDAVRNFWKASGCTLVEALEVASAVPAKILGLEKVKGTLRIGADADLVILDDAFNVLGCYVNGILCDKHH